MILDFNSVDLNEARFGITSYMGAPSISYHDENDVIYIANTERKVFYEAESDEPLNEYMIPLGSYEDASKKFNELIDAYNELQTDGDNVDTVDPSYTVQIDPFDEPSEADKYNLLNSCKNINTTSMISRISYTLGDAGDNDPKNICEILETRDRIVNEVAAFYSDQLTPEDKKNMIGSLEVFFKQTGGQLDYNSIKDIQTNDDKYLAVLAYDITQLINQTVIVSMKEHIISLYRELNKLKEEVKQNGNNQEENNNINNGNGFQDEEAQESISD